MQLKSYKIVKIYEDEQNIEVEFNFDDGSSTTHKIHCGDVGRDVRQPLVDEKGNFLTDKEGNQVFRTVVEKSPRFDIRNSEVLHQQIVEYAGAYIRGKEIERAQSTVHPDIHAMKGKEVNL